MKPETPSDELIAMVAYVTVASMVAERRLRARAAQIGRGIEERAPSDTRD